MKRPLLAVFLLISLILSARAADKANTVLIHPGEVIYARFESYGKKIKLVGFSKEKDDGAQVIFSFQPDAKKPVYILKVENKFTQALIYLVEMRSLTKKQQFPMPVSPVVGGKLAFETFPRQVEEVAAYGFQLEK